VTALRQRFGDLHGDARLDTLAEKVLAGQYDPYAAADEIIAAL
jgi:LAO/AO transport system kinase